MIRDLMLVRSGASGDDNALDAGLALATGLRAHLGVVDTVDLPLPSPSPWGATPDVVLAQLHAELRAQAQVRVADLRRRLAGADVSWDVRLAEALAIAPPRVLALQARHADLTVMTTAREQLPAEHGYLEQVFGALLFESGRPVLAVPPHHRLEWPMRHAVVAWQPTREATRALHDALPLLCAAHSVDVLMVDPVIDESHHGQEPGADIAGHLARHGLQVNVVVRPKRRTVAEALLAHAAQADAQLLVAGGYGHSRLREWALGGTTKELLRAICLPILFAH